MTANEPALLLLHSGDNVVIAVRSLPAGTFPDDRGQEHTLSQPIPAGHKVCRSAVAEGQPVVKYGQIIGFASSAMQPGDWVHTHNVVRGNLGLDHQSATEVPEVDFLSDPGTFDGFRRPHGRAGTRNYLAVISTVNCSSTSARRVVESLSPELLAKYPHVDGVIALTHKGGCAFEFQGPDHEQLNRTLAGYAKHPNVAGFLVLGLGCETAQGSYLIESNDLVQLEGAGGSSKASPLITIQESGGVAATVKRAVEAMPELFQEANRCRREPIPLSELVVGLECGGSDGYSGITANPAIGVAADWMVRSGGTVILSETPEIYGGEHLLTRRAVSREVADQLLERIRWWEDYGAKFGQRIDNNPSVGNKQGGLTTIYEKSLGAIAKAGSTPMRAVYHYAETVKETGFVVMDTPGYDPASVTGMIAGGAQVSVFSTGRGSCFGSKPAPTLKVCSNTQTYQRLVSDMDIDAGEILSGVSLEQKGREIFDEIVAVASGKQTKSEAQGIGDEEFCPWSPGPIF